MLGNVIRVDQRGSLYRAYIAELDGSKSICSELGYSKLIDRLKTEIVTISDKSELGLKVEKDLSHKFIAWGLKR